MTSNRGVPGLHEVDYHGWTGEQITKLRRDYPDWDFWFVARHMGPGTWCARPKGDPVATVSSDSLEDFREALEASLGHVPAEGHEGERQAAVTDMSVARAARKAGC